MRTIVFGVLLARAMFLRQSAISSSSSTVETVVAIRSADSIGVRQ
jgi:hypothetical protein